MLLSQLEDLVRRGQWVRAMAVFLKVLDDQTLGDKELARAYHCASIARYNTDEWYSALKFAEMAEDRARKAGDAVLLGKVWINMVEFCRRIGDLARAQEYGEMWLANIGMYPELTSQTCRVHYNLALVYRSRRTNSVALKHFRLALGLMGEAPISFRVQAHQMFAWMLYEVGQIDEGDEQYAAADALVDPEDTEGLREQLLLQILRAYQTGEYVEVTRLAEEFLAPGTQSTILQTFWAAWMTGMTAAKLGQRQAAKAISLLVKDYAMRLKSTEHMNRACELDRLIAQMGDEGEQAG